MKKIVESRCEVSMSFMSNCVDTFPHVGRVIIRYGVINLGPHCHVEFCSFISYACYWILFIVRPTLGIAPININIIQGYENLPNFKSEVCLSILFNY